MLIAPLIGMALVAAPAATASGDAQAQISAAMTDSATGWNDGDLTRFMAIYADDAIYAAGKEIAGGREAIAARYAKSFAAGGNTRGRLSFQPLAWRRLSAVHMLFVARWTLTPPGGVAPQTGVTTLLFERRKPGWRIISDHSS
ncbi:YybH family protein [Sphingomonas sp.]|jgi:uncharacterized protein (TIGR02246 family)|uniref:YybH family protein n=1 Tax=Sphingomonas sp. TaxID=28214 RepID=UPI0035C7A9D0